MIDTSKPTQGKETYNIVIRSYNGFGGVGQNYDQNYNVDFDTLLRHHPEGQKFRLKWTIVSANIAAHAGDHMGAVYVDFSSGINQYDTKYTRSYNVGFVNIFNISGGTFVMQHVYENTYVTIQKPSNNNVRVFFRNISDTRYFNGTDFVAGTNLPDFMMKLELQPVFDESD